MTTGPTGRFGGSTGLNHLPGKHDQSTHGGGGGLTGDAALAAPPKKLAEMTGDPRAAALWHRAGDNSLETPDGRPGFVGMNEEMRSGRMGDETRARVADVDSVMAESKLPQAIEVYRGVQARQLGLGKPGSLTGAEFTDKAFVSTSTDRSHAAEFGALVTIRVPEGTSAIRMADRQGHEQESEILLDRGLTFRVTAERGTPYTEHGISGFRDHEIDVEVVA